MAVQKKIFLLLILTQFIYISSFAQDIRENIAVIDSLIAIPYEVVVSEPNKAIFDFQKGIAEAQKIDYKYGMAKLYSKLALAYSSISKFDEYRDSQIKSIKIFEEMNNEVDLTHEYGALGYHLKKSNIDLSKHYMLLAIRLGEKNNLFSDLSAIYDNYGVVLEMNKQLDSAQYYYKKGLALKYELADSIGIPYSLNHLAGINAILGNFDKAFEYMAESDKYRANEKSNYGRAENSVITGELYLAVGKYDSAIRKFNESLGLAKIIGNKHMVQYNYEKLSTIYEKKKDYKRALENFRNHKNYQDSILNIETNKKIAELEIKFESEKKDKEISEAKLTLKEQKEMMGFIAAISILLFITSVGIYRFQKLKRKQIRKELEFKNKLARVEYENKMSEEKLRISRELHDNIGSHLTFMISSIDNLTYAGKKEKHIDELNKLSNFGRNTLNELRQTIWAMKNEESNLKQLVLKLTELKKQIVTGIEIKVTNNVKSEIILSSTQTLNLFRVIQEAVQNTIKYAEATSIQVLFNETDVGIQLTIKDNGKGFDINSIQMGNGISNMKFRCEKAGGTFSIRSSHKGTEITCNLKMN